MNWDDRLYLERLIKEGYSKPEMARIIGCSLKTIYNELHRGEYEHMNSDLTTCIKYSPEKSYNQYKKHLSEKGAMPKLLKAPKLLSYIKYMILEQHFSAEAILFEIKNNNLSFELEIKSVQTIYAAVRNGYIDGVHMADMPRKGRLKQKKQKVEPVPAYWREQKGNSIDVRPEIILDRATFGHWEMDCLCGKSTNRKTALVLTERKTRMEIVEQLRTHTMKEVVKALDRIEKRMGGDFYKVFNSITVDNGSEFKDYKGMEKALRRVGNRTIIYYCHARSPQERGSNENNNILLRRCDGLEKGSDFDKCLTYSKCKDAEMWINTYPRKIFNGRCSLELFNIELELLGCRLIE